jgi:predicted 3-demethylubiquinone-9 3-methyltransferase (glyoxalase superfamily)
MAGQKIKPCLWFDGQAEEAARFYVSIFPGSELGKITPGPDGKALVVEFKAAGVEFIGLNGGPMFKFTEAVSMSVDCADQEEVDRLWGALTEGGEESQCGWLKDRYGLSWQIVPAVLSRLLADPEKAGRVMGALMGMRKLDIRALEAAAAG